MPEGMGMNYEDVRKRMKRIALNNNAVPQKKANLMNSLSRQVRMRDGEKAERELAREIGCHCKDHSRVWI